MPQAHIIRMVSIDTKLLDDFIQILENHPEYREKLITLLYPSEFVRKDEMSELLKEIKLLRIDSNKKFDEYSKKFDEQIKEIKLLRIDSNKKFDEQGKRFDKLLEEIRVLSTGFGTIGKRTGSEFEELVRSLYKDIFSLENIDVNHVKKIGIRNNDPNILNGLKKITFDGYFHNGREILMEVKFSMTKRKVEWFYIRAKAYEKIKGNLPDLWIIAINIDEDANQFAIDNGIKVITRLSEY